MPTTEIGKLDRVPMGIQLLYKDYDVFDKLRRLLVCSVALITPCLESLCGTSQVRKGASEATPPLQRSDPSLAAKALRSYAVQLERIPGD